MIETSSLSAGCRALRHVGRLAFLPIAFNLLAAEAMSAERIALVIGNSEYDQVRPLSHVASDMAVMADTLRSLDFDVEALNDLDRAAMQEHILSFGQRIDAAGKNTIGLLFYAGHGFQFEGANYLLPVDADIEAIGDIEASAVNVDLALAEIAFATNDHKLVILDVPAEGSIDPTLGARPGLAAIDAPLGTLVAYGTRPDGHGQTPAYRGLYPLALANVMAAPRLTIEQVFQKVRLDVAEATGGLQVPWESSSLIGEVYLAGTSPAVETSPIDDVTMESAPSAADYDPRIADLVFWIAVEGSADPEDLKRYGQRFPDGMFKKLADHRLDALSKGDRVPTPDPAPPAEVDALHERLITQRRAHARAAPHADSVIVATIEPGQSVEVVGDVVSSDWFRVRLGIGIEAYMWASSLDRTLPPSGLENGLAATLPPSKSAILGRWHGEYHCQWDAIGFILDISDRQDDRADGLNAIFSFFALPGTSSLPSGSFAMTGDYDPDDGTIVLRASDWIEQPVGSDHHDLAGRAEIGGDVIAGRIETPGCSDFYLARGDGPEQPTAQSISTQ